MPTLHPIIRDRIRTTLLAQGITRPVVEVLLPLDAPIVLVVHQSPSDGLVFACVFGADGVDANGGAGCLGDAEGCVET